MADRRATAAVTVAVLCGLMLFGIVVGTKALFAPLPDNGSTTEPTPTPTCVTQRVDAGKRVRPKDVTVSVFNGSHRNGLAGETLAELGDRGFRAGEAGNAPEGTGVRFVQVWTTEEDDAAAKLVALQFGPRTIVKVAEDLGAGIDVVVGPEFGSLAENAPRFIRTRDSTEVCVPVE